MTNITFVGRATQNEMIGGYATLRYYSHNAWRWIRNDTTLARIVTFNEFVMAYNAFVAYITLPTTSSKSVSFENLDRKAVRFVIYFKVCMFPFAFGKTPSNDQSSLFQIHVVGQFEYTSVESSAILIEDIKCWQWWKETEFKSNIIQLQPIEFVCS